MGFVFGEIDRKIYPVPSIKPRSTPKANANDAAKRDTTRKTMTSISAAKALDDKEPDDTGVSQGEEQQRETAPPGKREDPKSSANDTTKRKSSRSTKTFISAGEALKEEEPDDNKATNIKTEEALAKEEPDEPGVCQDEEATQKTVVAPPGSLGLIIANIAESQGTVVSNICSSSVLADQLSPGDRIIAIDGEDMSAGEALKEEEPDDNKATNIKTEEALAKEEPDEPGVCQGEEAMQKTVVAPPGSLGLIIANIAESQGTVVSNVCSSSVLADQLSPDDRIIAIDGEDMSLIGQDPFPERVERQRVHSDEFSGVDLPEFY
jgi:C-terminal processing protease CtpA/Prc